MQLSRLVFASLVLACATAHAKPLDDLAFAVQEDNGESHARRWVVERLVTLELPEKCWAKVLDKKHRARALMAAYATNIVRYAAAVTGDDWMKIEGQAANNKDANRAVVDKAINDFAPKFHVTLKLEGDDCDASGNALWLKYLSTATGALVKYPPKSGKAFVTIDVKAKAKGVKMTVKDGSTFAITGARDVEASGWPNEIENPMKRVSTVQ